MDPHLVFSYQKNNRGARVKHQSNFTLVNITTAEFDSGISYQGIEGKNCTKYVSLLNK